MSPTGQLGQWASSTLAIANTTSAHGRGLEAEDRADENEVASEVYMCRQNVHDPHAFELATLS
jgi:hypothetical protein